VIRWYPNLSARTQPSNVVASFFLHSVISSILFFLTSPYLKMKAHLQELFFFKPALQKDLLFSDMICISLFPHFFFHPIISFQARGIGSDTYTIMFFNSPSCSFITRASPKFALFSNAGVGKLKSF